VDAIFHATGHPYTAGLKRAVPAGHGGERLAVIRGTPPDLLAPPAGCGFYLRCERALRLCAQGEVPDFDLADGHAARCWLRHPQVAQPIEPVSEQNDER